VNAHLTRPGTVVAELDERTIQPAYSAMKELRPHLSSVSEFLERVRVQRDEGYRLIGSFDASEAVVSVLGFRVAHSLALGRHIYIDDLSTLPAARERGHATALLAWIDDEARRIGCTQVHLDSATHRHDAHRRYLSSGFIIPALHFGKTVAPT
jgi:GNAT superfamily N-acetyltransferase